jgi:hypothetical protein
VIDLITDNARSRFGVLTAVLLEIQVCWEADTVSTGKYSYRKFEGLYYIYLEGKAVQGKCREHIICVQRRRHPVRGPTT